MRITALLASAVGNVMVKLPAVLVLSAPKSNTATAGSPVAVSLKIMQPLAVIVQVPKVKSAKSVYAVVLEVVGSTLVKVPPLAV